MLTLIDSLAQLPILPTAHALTIGNFDGVHLGHQAILKRLVTVGEPSIALTFSNHPAEILRPQQPLSLLCSAQERFQRLQQAGISHVISLPFSTELAQFSAEDFLNFVKQRIPFRHLVLGHDATIGKDRAGNRNVVQQLASRLDFQVEYEPALTVDNQVISSSLIRNAIRNGRLEQAAQWLGRPHSLSGEVIPGLGNGKKLGFPTLNIDVSRLCVPPFGVYAVTLQQGEQIFDGIANIGIAPTLRDSNRPVLEVHLNHRPLESIDGIVSVTLGAFIRPEKKFDSIEALKAQIAADVACLQHTARRKSSGQGQPYTSS